MSSRRAFFQDISLLAALAALVEDEAGAQVKDEQVSKFWDGYFAEATRQSTESTKGTAGGPNVLDPARQVQLIHATPDGLRYPNTIPDSDLRNDADNVVVTLNPGHF